MILKQEIIEQLGKELLLSYTGIEQDWDIETVDSKKIDDLSVDKKIAVMCLILTSYEDFLNENDFEIDERWKSVNSILQTERVLFVDLIKYWSLSKEEPPPIVILTMAKNTKASLGAPVGLRSKVLRPDDWEMECGGSASGSDAPVESLCICLQQSDSVY